jgi:hypothetical protein
VPIHIFGALPQNVLGEQHQSLPLAERVVEYRIVARSAVKERETATARLRENGSSILAAGFRRWGRAEKRPIVVASRSLVAEVLCRRGYG